MLELEPINRSREIADTIVKGLNTDFAGTLNALAHDSLSEEQLKKVVEAIKAGKKIQFPLVLDEEGEDKALYSLTISFTNDPSGDKMVDVHRVFPENHKTIEIGFKHFIILEEVKDEAKDISKQKNNTTKRRIRVGSDKARGNKKGNTKG